MMPTRREAIAAVLALAATALVRRRSAPVMTEAGTLYIEGPPVLSPVFVGMDPGSSDQSGVVVFSVCVCATGGRLSHRWLLNGEPLEGVA